MLNVVVDKCTQHVDNALCLSTRLITVVDALVVELPKQCKCFGCVGNHADATSMCSCENHSIDKGIELFTSCCAATSADQVWQISR